MHISPRCYALLRSVHVPWASGALNTNFVLRVQPHVKCLKVTRMILKRATLRVWFSDIVLVLRFDNISHVIDDDENLGIDQPSQGGSNSGDSSGPLFTMYSKIAEEEDDKMVERWQKDAEGIIIFVRSGFCFQTSNACLPKGHIDWFILCRRCYTGDGLDAGPQAKLTRYLRVLSREDVSAPSRPQRVSPIHPFFVGFSSSFLSPEICCLGEHTLVPEPGYQSHMCHAGDVVTTMGTSIHQDYSGPTAQSRETGTDACVLCKWRRQVSDFLGR